MRPWTLIPALFEIRDVVAPYPNLTDVQIV